MTREDAIRKVRAMIAKANDPVTPSAEKATCISIKDRFVKAWGITDAELAGPYSSNRAKRPEDKSTHRNPGMGNPFDPFVDPNFGSYQSQRGSTYEYAYNEAFFENIFSRFKDYERSNYQKKNESECECMYCKARMGNLTDEQAKKEILLNFIVLTKENFGWISNLARSLHMEKPIEIKNPAWVDNCKFNEKYKR